jgi:hypothetical protein
VSQSQVKRLQAAADLVLKRQRHAQELAARGRHAGTHQMNRSLGVVGNRVADAVIGGANSGRDFVVVADRGQRSPGTLAATTLFHSVRAVQRHRDRAVGTVVRFQI